MIVLDDKESRVWQSLMSEKDEVTRFYLNFGFRISHDSFSKRSGGNNCLKTCKDSTRVTKFQTLDMCFG